MRAIGYARVSTSEQDTQAQQAALEAAGCALVYCETASGGARQRPQLAALLEALAPGDVVVVWKLDRLSRSLVDLLHLLAAIEAKGAGFRSLTEQVDTTTAAGRMFAQLLGAFAEFERAMLKERTLAGLQRAREQGRIGGRRQKLTSTQREHALSLLASGSACSEVARLFRVHPSTIYRLQQREEQKE